MIVDSIASSPPSTEGAALFLLLHPRILQERMATSVMLPRCLGLAAAAIVLVVAGCGEQVVRLTSERGSGGSPATPAPDELTPDELAAVLAALDTDGDGRNDLDELTQGADPNEASDGPDVDGDGVPNAIDPDIDGDTIENAADLDMDGDGTLNGSDPDIDADGLPNAADPDDDADGRLDWLSGEVPVDEPGEEQGDEDDDADEDEPEATDEDLDDDHVPNDADEDLDGDRVPNDADRDVDGDGLPNTRDEDADGDGTPNEQDPEPHGAARGEGEDA
jgi:hypothetical protein